MGHRVRALLAGSLLTIQALSAAAQSAPDAESILARPLSFSAHDLPLADALHRLRHEGGIPLAWSGDLLPPGARVSVTMRDQPLGAVLAAVLEGTGLGVVVTRDGSIVVLRRVVDAPPDEIRRALTATGVRRLDEVIVMGTAVAGAPEREQPTAVAVAGPVELAGAAHTRLGDLMRTLLPGIVLWDAGPGGGPPRVTSVRGVSSFANRGLKSYVDGIEIASSDFVPLIDGRAIERIEVIRGPQGAALYGPDALNGILQIETRIGRPGGAAREVRLSATGGVHEVGGGGPVSLWQDHAAALGAGGARWGTGIAGSWSRVGTPGERSWQQQLTAHGGAGVVVGPVVARITGRAGGLDHGAPWPQVSPTTVVTQEFREVAIGMTLLHAITPAWRQSLTAGYHRGAGPRDPLRSFLLDPLLPLGATHERAARTAVRYGTAIDLGGAARPATISAGIEHSERELIRSVRRAPTSADLATLYRDDLRSTGAFGQLRARLGSGLVASGGARAEWSSSVGTTGGASWASTAGLSWSQPLGGSTLRLRGAWGRALRPPEPGMSRAMATATIRQEANDSLAPERQAGIELGADLYLPRGGWVRLTVFHQTADQLMQQVQMRAEGAVRAYQVQNVGAIRNRGAELEAGARIGAVALAGTVYLTESEVLRIAPRYTGALRPGDRLLEVPGSVGSVQARYDAGIVTAEAGVSWLGSWTGYDRAQVIEAERIPLATANSPSEFWIRYPGVVRPYLAVALDAGRGVSAFLRTDNPARTARFIRDNLSPMLGRTTMVGVTVVR